MVAYNKRILADIVSLYKLEVVDIIFFSGVLTTILIQFTGQDLFLFDVVGLLAFCLLVGIPLFLLATVLFPNYDLELLIAAIISLFLFYIIGLGLILVSLSYILNDALLSVSPAVSTLILSAVIIYVYSKNKISTPHSARVQSKQIYKILVIGLLFIITTVIFARHLRFNQPLLQTAIIYSVVISLAIIGSSSNLNKIETVTIIFIISLALIFHNELALPILGAGDSNKEYYVSNIVLAQANWPVGVPQSKFSVITIVIFHPVLTNLTPLSLEGMYRLVYPILFSVTPPVLYFVYRSSFSRGVSYWGTLLIVFLHPFYTVFALNTRTGYALLFIALLLLFYFYSQKISLTQRGLQFGLLFLLSTTYYAVVPIFILVLGVAKTAQVLDDYLIGDPTNVTSRIPPLDIAIFGVGATAWLLHTTQSYTFNLVTTILTGTISKASENLFSLSSSSGGSAFTQDFSYTYELITYLYILLTVLILISLILLTYLRYVRSANRQFAGAYYPIFIGGGLIFVAAFLPTSSIGIARLYTIGLIFLAPSSFFAICFVSGRLEADIQQIIPVLMIFVLLLSTGFLGIVLGDNRITQQHLIDDTSNSMYDYYASEWGIDFRKSGSLIYGSGDSDRLKSEFFVTEYESGVPGYSLLRSEDQTGLIYLSSRSVEDETITSKMWYRGGLATDREYLSYDQFDIAETHLVYSTGKSQVRYRG